MRMKTLFYSFEILWGLLVWMNTGCLHAEQVDRTIGQFVHTSWSAKDGAPGDIYTLAQTTDGFLWLGTMQGLYRFDGVTFEQYEPQSGPAFPSSNVTSLLGLPNGDLWIGFHEKGVSRLRGGTNTNYTNADGLPSGSVVSLVQDREGAIWAGTSGGLARFKSGRWQRIGDDWGYPGARAWAVYVNRGGTLWVATENTVVFLPPGSRKFQTTGVGIGQGWQIAESPGGALWLAETTRSVHPLLPPAWRPGVGPEIQVGSAGILFDDDGSLWITSLGDGMRRVPFPDRLNGRKDGQSSSVIESFTAQDGLTSDFSECILKDREGSIWVGTAAGLDRFSRGALVPILLPGKFAGKTMVAGDDGDIWVGSTSAALARIQGNEWRDIGTLTPAIYYGTRDPHDVLWFAALWGEDITRRTHRHLLRFENGRKTLDTEVPPRLDKEWLGWVLAADHDGTLWLANGPRSFLFLKNGRWEQFETPPEVAGKTALVAFTDAEGRVWFGFTDNTILVIDGANVHTFSAKDGLEVGSVKAITGRDRHIWIGGDKGLAVWRGDRFRAVVPADGDSFIGVSGVEEDSRGDLFLSDQRGVVSIPATEISRILTDPSVRVRFQTFDVRDGLSGMIEQTALYPSSAQGTDGRVWFSTSTGVVWIDPAHMLRNPLPPPVVIRSITANGVRYTSLTGLNLPPGTRDLTIDYTALSLVIPERVRFRYKLEGSDTQWQDAGVRRQAFYTNLSPREYRFRLMASNNDGVWNEAGTSLSFVIAPAWYQKTWFRGLYVLAFFMLLWVVYQMRVHQLQEQEKKFRDAIETMPVLAFVVDPKGNRTFMNRGWLEYTGLSPDQASASGWEKTIHPDDLNRNTERWRTSETTGQPLDFEARLRRGSDGLYRWFLIRAVPVRDKRGKVVKWCGAATDIEDRKRAEQFQADLTHASRVSTMGEMVASISHELAQPITITGAHAKASLRWLQREPPELTEVRKGTERIVEASTLATEIINRLRSLYKKAPPKRELVAINEVIGEMAVMMGGQAREHGATIRTDLKDDLPMTVADRVQLQQVLMNLMLNGIEAMKDTGGLLTVKSQLDEGGQIQISIHDTGPGLPPGKADQIFDAFFTTKPQGSGMGLAICKSIVESQGGRIWAAGDGGRGAMFHFTLPAAPAETNSPFDSV
jgi:PAS domain S-box-containing protein